MSSKVEEERGSSGWPVREIVAEPRLERVLVVVDDATLAAERPEQTPLLARTATLAASSGGQITLYAPCSEETLAQSFLTADDAVRLRQQEMVDLTAARLTRVKKQLEAATRARVTVRARWEPLDAPTLLERIGETQPDLVMKTASGESFFIGLLTNTDWELIRRSPAPVWYITDQREPSGLRNVLTALGADFGPREEIINARDYDVCALANLIAERNGATNLILHTYQIPMGITPYAAYVPEVTTMPVALAESDKAQERTVAKRHGQAIRAFASYFHIDPERIALRPGRLSDVAPAMASELGVDLIVMGARQLTRLERLLKPVNAEPMLARAPCDVLVVTDIDRAAPTAREEDEGTPGIDLETAIANPEQAFGSPRRLVDNHTLSVALRHRLLALWENDVRAEMVEEEEGGLVHASRADQLQALHQARETLEGISTPAAAPRRGTGRS